MKKVYASGKVFHFPEKLRDIREGRVTAPIHIRLKPTNRCNHRCQYCCYRSPNLLFGEKMHEQDEIPIEKIREIIDDFGRMGLRAVTLSGGGEPTCYPHILETLERLREAGIKVAMLTNGSLLSGEVAQYLATEATWIRISMDAAQGDLYAWIRQVSPQEFEKVCDNIVAFAAIPDRTCVLGVNYVVNRENSDQVLEFLRTAKAMGADHVKVSSAVVSMTPETAAAYIREFYDSVKRQISDAARSLQDARFQIIDKVHLPQSQDESFRRGYHFCPSTHVLTVIGADQNVYTCQDKAYSEGGLLGSIETQRFETMWFGEETRRRLEQLDPSRDCRHHCVSHARNLAMLDYLEADEEHAEFV